MELVEQYIELQPKWIPQAAVDPWERFVRAPHEDIAIIAGRGTGKTRAVCRRALTNKRDTIIVTTNNVMRRHTVSMLSRLRNDIQDATGMPIMILTIDEFNSSNYAMSDVEIIFEEPEQYDAKIQEFFWSADTSQGFNVVMVGSLITYDTTYFKRFYEVCKYKDTITFQHSFIGDVALQALNEIEVAMERMSPEMYKLTVLCEYDHADYAAS